VTQALAARHAERGDPQEGVHRARSAGRRGLRRRVHRLGNCCTTCRQAPSRWARRRAPLRGHRRRELQGLWRLHADLPNPIDLLGYTDAQITEMITNMAEVPISMPAATRDVRKVIREEAVWRPRILAALAEGPRRTDPPRRSVLRRTRSCSG